MLFYSIFRCNPLSGPAWTTCITTSLNFTDSFHPMKGHSCSLILSWLSSPAPFLLSVPPPNCFSSSCCPEERKFKWSRSRHQISISQAIKAQQMGVGLSALHILLNWILYDLQDLKNGEMMHDVLLNIHLEISSVETFFIKNVPAWVPELHPSVHKPCPPNSFKKINK